MVTSQHSAKLGKRGLVIGASMAGLLAARALSDYFEQVTLIDRDTLPEESAVRKGIPQGKHIHVLMIRGQQILEKFFPDFIAAMDQSESPSVSWLSDTKLYLSNGFLKRNDLNIVSRTSTRPNLEWIVRQQLLKIPNINIIQNCQVDSLMTDAAKTRVTGLNISYRRGADDTTEKPETLTADLVVDASGRHSKLPDWLQTIGYEAPTVTRVNPKLAYASRLYGKLAYEPDWKFFGINSVGPDQPRAGGITLQERGQWMVTMWGYGSKNQPPTDEASYFEFAKSLPSSELYDAIKTGTPLTDISGYADVQNIWHHYEQLKRMPQGLIVLGDSVCCFNPVYAQGMTTAALSAEALADSLSKTASLDALGAPFQKRLAKIIAGPWLLATNIDFSFAETEGKRPTGPMSLAQGYLDRLMGAMRDDPQVASAFIQVVNMLKTPTALFSPGLILKVLTRPADNKAEKAS
jgi:2-polyprenyl-6-methoxyphenol hydroxylase-like FAD-dependent oxidoreductase